MIRQAKSSPPTSQLMNTMPTLSHYRRILIHCLFSGIDTKMVSRMCNCSIRTVQDARKKAEYGELLKRYGRNLCRQRYSTEELEPVLEWINEQECPVKSGTIYHQLTTTKSTSYINYVTAFEQPCFSYKYYQRLLKRLHIRSAQKYQGHFDCKVCGFLQQNINRKNKLMEKIGRRNATQDEQYELNIVSKRIDRAHLHQLVGPHQRNVFRTIMQSLQLGQVLVVLDTTTHYPDENGIEDPSRFGANHCKDGQKWKKVKRTSIRDLVLVCYRMSEENVEKEIIHMINEHGNNNASFVIKAWMFLFEKTSHFNHDEVSHVFNDGSSKEFKNRNYQYFNSTILNRYGKFIWNHFFSSWHGYNVADGASARTKKLVRQCARDEKNYVVSANDTVELFNNNLGGNTHTYEIDMRNVSIMFDVKGKWSHGVKWAHCISYPCDGVVIMTKRSFVLDEVSSQIFDVCLTKVNDEKVGLCGESDEGV